MGTRGGGRAAGAPRPPAPGRFGMAGAGLPVAGGGGGTREAWPGAAGPLAGGVATEPPVTPRRGFPGLGGESLKHVVEPLYLVHVIYEFAMLRYHRSTW